MTPTSSGRSIRSGALLTYITHFTAITVSLLYVPVMLRALGQEEYGLYALVQSLAAWLQMSDLGIGTTAVRYNAKYLAERDFRGLKRINGMFFVIYLAIALCSALIGLGLYLSLGNIYRNLSPESLETIKLLLLLALLNLFVTFVFKLFESVITARERFVFLKTLRLIQAVAGPGLLLLALGLHLGSPGMMAASALMSLGAGAAQLIYCLTKLKVKLSFTGFETKTFRTLFSFTLFVFLSAIAHQLFTNSDKVIISLVMGGREIAIYAVVLQLDMYFYTFSNVLSEFYLPRLTRMASEGDSQAVMDELIRVGRIQTVIAGLIFGGFLALGRPFLNRWLGPEYGEAYLLTVLVLLPQVPGAAQSLFTSLMQAMDLHRARALIALVMAGIKAVLAVVLIRFWGLAGCAASCLIAYLLRMAAYNLYYGRRVKLSMSCFWGGTARALAAALAAGGLLYLLFSRFAVEGWGGILLGSIGYTALYLLFIGVFGMTPGERRRVWSLVRGARPSRGGVKA